METTHRSDRLVEPIQVERWPTEIPLLVLVVLASLALWFFLAVSIVGLLYVLLIGLALFFAHLAFVTYIRGSAVRLGPDQFPELYQRVRELAARAGIDPVPEAYIMQAGGILNALATKFLRSKMIVVYSDLLEACGDNRAARDMIIGHELGHIKAGHLRWIWILAPGLLVPLLGAAYSRARELTCDRYGVTLSRYREGALVGLAILAAGGLQGPKVNLQALIQQRRYLDTGWMTLGKWFSGYPPLCERVAALQPSLAAAVESSRRGPVRAVLLLGAILSIPILAAGVFAPTLIQNFQEALEEATVAEEASSPPPPVENIGPEAARTRVGDDFSRLSRLVRDFRQQSGTFPADAEAVYALWRSLRVDEAEPIDPFDGRRYGYYTTTDGFVLWSSGPDGVAETDDDIVKEERVLP